MGLPSGADLRRFRYDVRSRIATIPGVAALAVAENAAGARSLDRVLTPRTELLIDGFQSSGNSFATAVVTAAAAAQGQPRPVLAHHLHCPRQVVRAARRGVPVMLLFRRPDDAVISLVSRWPHLGVEQGVRAWNRYYAAVAAVLPTVVVTPFERLIAAPDAAFERLNERYRTELPTVSPSQAKNLWHGDDPSRAPRRAMAAERRPQLDHPGLQGALAEANRRYEQLSAAAR